MRRLLPVLLFVVACFGSSSAPARPSWPHLPAAVQESSGLARSARFGAFWTHGDSGNDPVLYEITTSGRLLRSVPITGATSVDWEDIAPDGQGGVWIADCGNNANMRQDLALFHVPASALVGAGPAAVDRTLAFSFPGQTAFPMPGALNFDCEALFVDGGVPFVLTKHRSDQRTVLHKLVDQGDGTARAVPLGAFDVGGKDHPFGGMVTSADLHPSGRWLAVLTYHALFVFQRPEDGEHWLTTPVSTVELVGSRMGQTEAVSWDGSGLVLTNEAGVVFRLDDPMASGRRFPEGPPP